LLYIYLVESINTKDTMEEENKKVNFSKDQKNKLANEIEELKKV